MTTTEHLEKIKAKCLANLALAENRTQGTWEWKAGKEIEYDPYIDLMCGYKVVLGPRHDGNFGSQLISTPSDRTYIAACAGAAESGWKSTIAAIETAQLLESVNSDITNAIVDAIIAAWPEELL